MNERFKPYLFTLMPLLGGTLSVVACSGSEDEREAEVQQSTQALSTGTQVPSITDLQPLSAPEKARIDGLSSLERGRYIDDELNKAIASKDPAAFARYYSLVEHATRQVGSAPTSPAPKSLTDAQDEYRELLRRNPSLSAPENSSEQGRLKAAIFAKRGQL